MTLDCIDSFTFNFDCMCKFDTEHQQKKKTQRERDRKGKRAGVIDLQTEITCLHTANQANKSVY